jgi:hypothetical protein
MKVLVIQTWHPTDAEETDNYHSQVMEWSIDSNNVIEEKQMHINPMPADPMDSSHAVVMVLLTLVRNVISMLLMVLLVLSNANYSVEMD